MKNSKEIKNAIKVLKESGYDINESYNLNVRQYTTAILEMGESGELSWEDIARECLTEMSEDDVKEMCRTTEWVNIED